MAENAEVKGRLCRFATLDSGVLSHWAGCMNTTEESMHQISFENRFEALHIALQAAGTAIGLVGRVPATYRSIANQVVRSASSVPANLAEGHGHTGKSRLHHYRIAYGSAKEVEVHLRLLASAGAIERPRCGEAIELFDRVRAITWRLLNPRP